MKTGFYLTLIILLAGTQLRAQSTFRTSFAAGSWQVGLHDGYTGGDLIGKRNTLQLQTGYYLINRLSVGLGATWAREGTDGFTYHELAVGPSVRFHFTATRISPFIDLSYQFGSRSAAAGSLVTYRNQAMQSTQISPGVSFGLIPSLRIELLYNVQWVHSANWTSSIIQPHVGITYLFAKN